MSILLEPPVTCYACCTDCCTISPIPVLTGSPVLTLSNLLPIGSLRIAVSCDPGPYEALCTHVHAQDKFHPFEPTLFLHQTAQPSDADILRQIQFLLDNQFFATTYQFNDTFSHIIIRIYMIPWDLPGMEGKMRVRDTKTSTSAYHYLSYLLPQVSNDPKLWHGVYSDHALYTSLFGPDTDVRTMSEIYSELPSPQPTLALDLRRLERMKSKLYPYQLESVSRMLEVERLCPKQISDPLFVPIKGVHGGNTFFLKPSTMELVAECPMYGSTKGGVLCEELGTGKTVIILSLVLASIGQLSSPEEIIEDSPPTVMTPLSYRHFPSPEARNARRLATNGKRKEPQPPILPSLVELAIHTSRVSPLPRADLGSLPNHLAGYCKSQTPLYHTYRTVNAEQHRRPSRGAHEQAPPHRVMYLTSATLIVVPNTLIGQWEKEVQKHFHVGSAPRLLVARMKKQLPLAQRLASDYDIVLMTLQRFISEGSKNTISKLYTRKPCECPSFPNTRIPNCECSCPEDVSKLLQIRWSRLVIDEGHNTGNNVNSNISRLARLLSVESRWIVTGTPATNLLGLSFGRAKKGVPSPAKKRKLNGEVITDGSGGEVVASDERQLKPRIWTPADRSDLGKFAVMVTNFLDVSRFSEEPKAFNTHVVKPLLQPNGPALRAVEVLTQTMNLVMIRHRIEDVEKDVELPPVTQETVLLDLEPHGIKSYNALQVAIAVNAIDSQREDQDYMFHSKNKIFLRITIDNMSQILFFSVDSRLYNTPELEAEHASRLETAQHRLAEAPTEEKKRILESDIRLLTEAYTHIQAATKDELWKSLQQFEEMPYHIQTMPRPVFNAWSRTPASAFSTTDQVKPCLIHVDRLCRLRDLVERRPLISTHEMENEGEEFAVEEEEATQRLAQKAAPVKPKDKSKIPVDKAHTSTMLKKVSALKKKTEVEIELDRVAEARKLLESIEDDDEGVDGLLRPATARHPLPDGRSSNRFLRDSSLATARIGNSTSSKLNFVLSEVLAHSANEKFLIFSASPLTLAHIAEGLDVINVNYLQFTTKESQQERERFVLAFETSPKYSVFLMELRHGARGLNLVAASRILFCEPVWQADVESQAIKRAHRIGQTRPISVKTLAIRNTHEEEMMKRRKSLKLTGVAAKVHMTDEAGMRNFIENPQFLSCDPDPSRLPSFNVPLFKLPPESPSLSDIEVDANIEAGPSSTASTRLRFTDSSRLEDGRDLQKKERKNRKVALRFGSLEPMEEEDSAEAGPFSILAKKRKKTTTRFTSNVETGPSSSSITGVRFASSDPGVSTPPKKKKKGGKSPSASPQGKQRRQTGGTKKM